MADYSISADRVMERLGLESLPAGIRAKIFLVVRERLEDNLEKKTNKFFGWSDCRYVDAVTDCCEDVVFAAVIKGRITLITVTDDKFIIDEDPGASQKLNRAIMRWLDILDADKILREIATEANDAEKREIAVWKNIQYQRNPVMESEEARA